jgi:peptidoglycan hydrolase CwlO-like protein
MRYILSIIALSIILPALSFHVIAQNTTSGSCDVQCLTDKISKLQGEETSLSNQINLFTNQISLLTLKIESTKTAIAKLSYEINQLAIEIDRLEIMLTKRAELVISRIPESYKRQTTPQFGMLFFSQDFGDFLSRVKYITSVQSEDVQSLRLLKLTQNNFGERKNTREEKMTKQVELKAELEVQNRELARKKQEKQILLTETKSSEVVYQRLLAQALAEKNAVDQAVIAGSKVGPIKRGEPISLVGNSGYPGCSTGPHLHFEVRKNNNWVDPAIYLSSRTVNDEQNGGTWTVGWGGWEWPIQDTIRMTQHFGRTAYSWRYAYSGGIHTGFDMVSTSSDVIRAPADGTLYSSSQSCGGSSVIKIKYIDHGDGVLSFYLHVQ